MVFAFGHDFGKGLCVPAERVSDLVPFGDEVVQAGSQMVEIFEVHDTKSFAAQDGKPLFHLIHPRTMHRRKRESKSWMICQPLPDQLSMMSGNIIQDHVNRGDSGRNFEVNLLQLLQQLDQFNLPFSSGCCRPHTSCPRVERSEQIQGSAA